MTLRFLLTCAVLASFIRVTEAAPLVLYDPSGKAPNKPAARDCSDLTAPCDTLNTDVTTTAVPPAAPPISAPLPSDWRAGGTGYVSAGISNHGNAESAGVAGWLSHDDTTISVAISGLRLDANGFKTSAVPLAPKP